METHLVSKLLTLFLMTLFMSSELIQCTTVTYDKKAIIINGQRRLLISGSIHYPRSTPEVFSLYLSVSFILLLCLLLAQNHKNVIFVTFLLVISVKWWNGFWCRCGKVLYRKPKMEAWMSLTPTFSGMVMNLLLAMYASSPLCHSSIKFQFAYFCCHFNFETLA